MSESLKAFNAEENEEEKRYCSFFIADFEIALPLESVQEIVNYPEVITKVPMTPEYCVGLFNLRGMIVPVIHITDLLGEKRRVSNSKDQKVAITNYHDIKVGLVFDATNEILKISGNERQDVVYQETSTFDIVKGILKLEEGRRLLHILDPEALIKLDDIPHVMTKVRASGQSFKTDKKEKQIKGITFRVDNVSMFTHMSEIFEIIQVPKFEKCFVNYPYTKGLVNLRGMMIPVIEMKQFLQGEESSSEDESLKRVIVLGLPNKHKLGILVDSVDAIVTYIASDVLPVPKLSQFQEGLYQGYLSHGEEGKHLMMNSHFYVNHTEINHVIEGHAKLCLGTQEDSKNKTSSKETFISFKMGEEFCFPILDIREIIDLPQDFTRLPGSPAYLLGIYNLRGHSVSLIHIDSNQEKGHSRKVIILKNENEYVGLVVDSVEDIFTIYDKDKFPCPPLFKSSLNNRLGSVVRELVLINDGRENINKKLAVFDAKEFFNPMLYVA